MRLAYFTPLPPSKSGIADYNSELLPYLAKGAEISVFVEEVNVLPQIRDRADFLIHDANHFDDVHARQPFDMCVYHLGNNPHHEYVYERAIRTPGLLVMHESCMHHLITWKTLRCGDKESYWDEMFYAYGRRGARVADMRANAVASDYQQFLMPLNRRVTQGSLGVIVHNAYTASNLEGIDGDIPVKVIPHHLSPRAYELDGINRSECRRSLGIPDDAWVIASFGFVTESKRIPVVLAAFRRLLEQVPDAMYLVVGDDHPKCSVAPLIEEMGLRDRARVTGYVSEDDFFRYLKAVDVMVNLRFPTAGETSGTLIRALGAGIPVVVTDFGQFAELPDDVCLKVPAMENEEGELYLRLRALALRPMARARLSRRSAEWIRAECDINHTATRYLNFIERVIESRKESEWRARSARASHHFEFLERPTIKLDRDEALSYVAGFFTGDPNGAAYIKAHCDHLISTLRLTPSGSKDQRLLDLSGYLHMPLLLKHYGGYSEIALTSRWDGEPKERVITARNPCMSDEFSFLIRNVDVERDRFPFPDAYFDVALRLDLIGNLLEDPMGMLVELNRVMKWGGLLILSTPSNPARTPDWARVALEYAGFKVIKLFTESNWGKTNGEIRPWPDQNDAPREPRGGDIFAVARKQSDQIERYPLELYD